ASPRRQRAPFATRRARRWRQPGRARSHARASGVATWLQLAANPEYPRAINSGGGGPAEPFRGRRSMRQVGMATIIGISGSLRQASFNTALLRAAVEFAPPELTIEVRSIRDIPLYDGDLEASSGVPAAAAALKDDIAGADGLLLVTPEYNGSLPGVFKNAIDWLSRPAADIPRVFGMKPVGVIGATPGLAGTRLSQTAWLPVLR